jgi:hypothetical protein
VKQNGSASISIANGPSKEETPEEAKLRLKRERLEAWKAKKAAEAAKGEIFRYTLHT